MKYLERLDSAEGKYRNMLDRLLVKYKVQRVGSGYFDLIVRPEYLSGFVSELTENELAIEILVWWCHCSKENEQKYDCPHGYGGPYSDYFSGWFSEMPITAIEIDDQLAEMNENPTSAKIKKINEFFLEAIRNIDQDKDYSPCLVPSIGVYVPGHWYKTPTPPDEEEAGIINWRFHM